VHNIDDHKTLCSYDNYAHLMTVMSLQLHITTLPPCHRSEFRLQDGDIIHLINYATSMKTSMQIELATANIKNASKTSQSGHVSAQKQRPERASLQQVGTIEH